MAQTITIGTQVSGFSTGIDISKVYSGEAGTTLADVAVPDSSTDLELLINIDVSTIQALILLSTKDMTLDTNSTGAPDDTIALKANAPLVWTNDGYHANPLGTDVTKFFLTTGSVGAAVFNARVVYDATP